MKGPDLTNLIVGFLMRFRKESIAIIADVEAMYHQVRGFSPDRDALRFFWWPERNLSSNPDTYRMTVHLFGAKGSPSCASYCLRETAREFGKHYDPEITELVYKNFYVDYCLVSVDSPDHAIKVVENLRELLSKGGFELIKWLSSCDVVMQTIPEEEKAKSARNVMPSSAIREYVLGMDWHVPTDEFPFNIVVPESCAIK